MDMHAMNDGHRTIMQAAGVPQSIVDAASAKAIPLATIWAIIQALLPVFGNAWTVLEPMILAWIQSWVTPPTPVVP